MKLHPRVTRAVIELVKGFEGLRRRAARLPDGGWTIGYGHTLSAREGAVVSPEDAEALLYYDLSEVARKVDAWTFTSLNQNQFEALTAFAFNIGVENFRRSTVLKRVNEGQNLMAAAALELWRKSDFAGEDLVIDALVRRRAAEKAHYLTPPEGHRPSPTPVLKPLFDHSIIEAAASARAGRSAAVVDAPLDGDRAFATLEPEIKALDDPQTAKIDAEEADAVSPFVLKAYEDEVNQDAPASWEDSFGKMTAFDQRPSTPLNVPSDPPEAAPVVVPISGSVRPTADNQEEDGAPPKPVAISPRPAPLFEASATRPTFGSFDPARSAAFGSDGKAPDRIHPFPSTPLEGVETAIRDPARPRFTPSLIYILIGLLGGALFIGAVLSMLTGKASPANLFIGLLGILLMAPAGGYFLLHFLNRRDGVDA